ncbi:hypothetical protein M569_00620, partial [Genlisea aurea]
STTRNSMRNFSIQCLFLNNLIFQFLNHFILPSSLLARLIKIYMFRCTNNMLFLTSSFFGWLIGHILLLQILEFLSVWQKLKKKNYIRSNKYIQSKKYFGSEMRNLMDQLFRIKLNKTKNVEEGVEKKMTYEQANENKQEDEKKAIYTSVFYTEQTDKKKIEDTEKIRVNRTKAHKTFFQKSYLLHSNNNSKNSTSQKYTFGFEKFLMSQYFFGISNGDGKETISFTYPPIFSIFLESTKKGLYWLRLEKDPDNEVSDSNSFQKVKKLKNEFLNRIEGIDNESTCFNLLEIRPQLCYDDSIHKYFSKRHDPLFNGPYRRPINLSCSIQQKINIMDLIENFGINKLHHIFLENAYLQQLEIKEADLDKKMVSTHFFDSLIFIKKFLFVKEHNSIDLTGKNYLLLSKGKPDSNYFITTNSNGQKNILRKAPKIQKKVPHWLYKLIDEVEQQSGEQHENGSIDYEIRSRKAKRVVILTTTNDDPDSKTNDSNTSPSDEPNEVALIRYSQQPDFRRGLIKVQIVTEETNEKLRIEIAEAWDTIPFAQIIRGMMLLTQSVVRKYIILPSLILGKNIGRILLFQLPEWSEDLQEWNREMYVKCTYNGVPLSETEFPQNWLTDGIQIKIIFPFRMKPWHNSKRRSFPKNRNLRNNKKEKNDFCFLTIWGLESEFPFGRPRKQPSFFKPIFKELEKKKNKFHRIIHQLFSKIKLPSRTASSLSQKKINEKLFLISITNNMGHILYMKKGADRKYFDCKIINFELRQKTKIETWITTNINRNQNLKIRTTNYKKITKKDLIIYKINRPNSKKEFFDWMGMNHETLKKENESQEEHELPNRKDLESFPSQKNNIEENDTKLNIKKENTRKQYKSKTEAELELFLNRYLLFQFRGNEVLTQPMLSNIKVYCLLLRLMDQKKITLSSIQKRELDLDIMLINLNLTRKELLKKGLFIIEPIRLSGKDGYFIMYQTVSISLVHKSKNQKQRYVASKQLAEMILPQQRITASEDKNFNLCIPENILSFRRCRTLRI